MKKIRKELENSEQKYQKEKEQLLTKEIPEIESVKIPVETKMLNRLKLGMSKTKKFLVNGFFEALVGNRELDDTLFDEIEEKLLTADIGVPTSRRIMDVLEEKYEKKEINTEKEAFSIIQSIIKQIMKKESAKIKITESGPSVFLFVGVNGVGKTTSIGKIAAKYKSQGKKVLLAAGDTFRASAIEQLMKWSERVGVDILKKDFESDPSATMYEAVTKAVNEKYDIVLCDTSGRLHTNKNLMAELEKMKRVIQNIIPEAPHNSLLVLDATTGQNAIRQTKEFRKIIGIDGLIITKLDGTSKGGVVIGIVNEFEIPVFYIGVGESVDDLQTFSPELFSKSLFEDSKF